MRTALKLSGIAILAAFLLASCHSSDPTSASGIGRLSVRLTDAPTNEVSAVKVYVTGLTVKPSGGPAVRIVSDVGLVDLLELQGTTLELVDLGVPAGDYEFVQIDLDQARSSVVEIASGETKALAIPGQEVKVLGKFTVPDGGSTIVTLDFDAAASLQHLGNGDWLLVPVISQSVATG